MKKNLSSTRTFVSCKRCIPYSLIQENRKTISLSVIDGMVVVKAPRRASLSFIDSFVDLKSEWIEKRLRHLEEAIKVDTMNPKEREAARLRLLNKTKIFLSTYDGIKPKRIFIRASTSRWGSCSSLGNISLSIYLDAVNDELFEYVLLHELTHLYFMNHSTDFWTRLARQMPDYKERRKQLKKYILPKSNKG
ncbi:MAG TPA: DUF45 domain-containing protein [Bacillota bacterium]|nr:DUF45 domain-containing protein [Bacillota bacterium]HPE39284.1 DUF45 domain-containing protein [Bacillota bacterium]